MRRLSFARSTAGALMVWALSGVAGCRDVPVGPEFRDLENALPSAAQAATRTHSEFSGSDNLDIYFSCVNEVVKYRVSYTATLDINTSASGITSIRLRGILDPTSYVERASGVRYYAFGHAHSENHEVVGPVHVIEGAIPQLFRSADGDVLVSNFHYQLLFDKNGDPTLEKFTGACP